MSNALSGNEALDWFQKKEERARVEKEKCKIERKKQERECIATERHLWHEKMKAECESKRLKEKLTSMYIKAEKLMQLT